MYKKFINISDIIYKILRNIVGLARHAPAVAETRESERASQPRNHIRCLGDRLRASEQPTKYGDFQQHHVHLI